MGSQRTTMKSLRTCINNLFIFILLQASYSRAASGIPSTCRGHIDWAFNTGKNTNPEWYASMKDKCGVSVADATFEDFQRLFKCEDIAKKDCNDRGLQFPSSCSVAPCDVCTISPPIPSTCRGHLQWAYETGKVSNPEWYSDMTRVCGVSVQDATFEDFQRLFKCENIASSDCNDKGLQYPAECTSPPCDTCESASCCAKENEDVYNPNICPGEAHPVDCCDGLERTFVPGPNNFVCQSKSQPTERPPPNGDSTTNPMGHISIQGRNVLVNNKIFYMKGVNWNPVPVGRSHPPRYEDFLNYAKQDAPKMRDAGINIIRTYATVTHTDVLQIFVDHGIRVINPINPLNSYSQIKDIVDPLKNHDGIFMWALGNEWNYNHCYMKDSGMSVDACAQKIREASNTIKSRDSYHPITTIYGEVPSKQLIDSMPNVDAWGLNVYSGDTLGNRFNDWSGRSTKPMYFAEYGADAYNAKIHREDEQAQAYATTKLVGEIKEHSTRNNGPCFGGIIFEWADEWWKAPGSTWTQDVGGIAPGGGPWPDFTFNEEYWGLVTIDRKPRDAYYAYKNA